MIQNAKDLEDAVIGALLLEPFRMPTVAPILKEEYFYSKQNQYVFRALKKMYDANEVIDILTVTQHLQKVGRLQEVGGAYFLSSLATRLSGGVNVEHHARIVHQYYILRELTILGHTLINESTAQNADCFDIIEKMQKKSQELTTLISTNVKHVGDVFAQLTENIKEAQVSGKPAGIPAQLEQVDRYTGGWQNGNLIILAARPGMGKTAFALHAAKGPAIKSKIPTGIFSLEMTALELVGRLAASESRTNSSRISQASLTPQELSEMVGGCLKLIDAPIYIDDSPALSFARLRSVAIKMVYEFGVKLIIIDYLQLLSGEGNGNRELEISSISRGLKALAKELNIPVIALSQLSREVERRPDKRPMLSDLRESGSIEQDADIVMFLWRPEYYDLCEEGYEFNSKTYGNLVLQRDNLMILDIAKGRNLRPGELPLLFYGEYMETKDYPMSPIAGPENGIVATPLSTNDNFLNHNEDPFG